MAQLIRCPTGFSHEQPQHHPTNETDLRHQVEGLVGARRVVANLVGVDGQRRLPLCTPDVRFAGAALQAQHLQAGREGQVA